MQNRLAKILFSTRLTAVLFIVFAVAMATGTILDRNMGTSPTPYTRNLIYNAWWFEAIMVMFVVNFVGNFIFILIGAGITRYISYEGMIAIREGETESSYLSQKTYVTAYIDGNYMIDGVPQRLPIEEEVDFSPRMTNSFEINTNYDKQPVSIKLVGFIEGAEQDIVPDENGDSYLKIVESSGGSPHNHFLKEGTVQNIHNLLIALNKPTEGAVNITNTPEGITINSPFEGEYLQMATMTQGRLVKDSIQSLMLRSRYIIGDMQLVFPKPVVKGKFDIVKKSKLLKQDENAIVLDVTANGETKQVKLLGSQWSNNPFTQTKIGGLDIALKYGSKAFVSSRF